MSMARVVIVLLLTLPYVTLAQAKNFSELASTIVGLINTATTTLIVFGLVAYFYGLAVNIPHFGDEKGAEKRKSFFFWGIIIIFVMVSIWGIVRILQNTLFGGDAVNPSSGQVQAPCANSECPEGFY